MRRPLDLLQDRRRGQLLRGLQIRRPVRIRAIRSPIVFLIALPMDLLVPLELLLPRLRSTPQQSRNRVLQLPTRIQSLLIHLVQSGRVSIDPHPRHTARHEAGKRPDVRLSCEIGGQ